MNKVMVWLGIVLLATGAGIALSPQPAHAAATFVRTANANSNNSSSLSATLSAAATAGNLLIAVCGSNGTTITGPAGFTTAINQNGTPSQGIFFKIAAGGETSLSCSFSASGFVGIHIYEYSGIDSTNPLLSTGSATGSSSAVGSGSTTTTVANALLFAGVTTVVNTAFSAWSNSFTERSDFAIGSGNPGQRMTFGGGDRSVSSTGTYTTTATAGANGAWRGQIVAFREVLPVLGVDFVNATGTPIASPSVSLSTVTSGFDCQTATGTLAVSNQRIRVTNTTGSPAWTLTVAATAGSTALWSSGSATYDFNDNTGSTAGCADGADADSRAGLLAISTATGSITPQSGCGTTGLSFGSPASFVEGSVHSITLLTANGTANTNCYWDVMTLPLTQQIPADQAPGNYSLQLTVTIAAS